MARRGLLPFGFPIVRDAVDSDHRDADVRVRQPLVCGWYYSFTGAPLMSDAAARPATALILSLGCSYSTEEPEDGSRFSDHVSRLRNARPVEAHS
jgi:hypothetical protein